MIYRNKSWNLFSAMDIEGEVKARIGKKWKTRWCHLRKDSQCNMSLVATLNKRRSDSEVRKSSSSSGLSKIPTAKTGPSGGGVNSEVVNLPHICGYHIAAKMCKEERVLAVVSTHTLLMLSFSSEEQLRKWEKFLKSTIGEEQSFNLFIVDQPKASRVKNGFGKLYVKGASLALVALSSTQLGLILVASCHTGSIKRVTLSGESDRKLSLEGKFDGGEMQGEGKFGFQCTNVQELYQVLSEKMHKTEHRDSQVDIRSDPQLKPHSAGQPYAPLNFYAKQYIPQVASAANGCSPSPGNSSSKGRNDSTRVSCGAALSESPLSIRKCSAQYYSSSAVTMRSPSSTSTSSSSGGDRFVVTQSGKTSQNYDVPPHRYRLSETGSTRRSTSSLLGNYDVPSVRNSLGENGDKNNNSTCTVHSTEDKKVSSVSPFPMGRRHRVGLDGKRVQSADTLLLASSSSLFSSGFAGGSSQSGFPLPLGKRSMVSVDGSLVYPTITIPASLPPPPEETDFPITRSDFDKKLKYIDLSKFDGDADRDGLKSRFGKDVSDHIYQQPRLTCNSYSGLSRPEVPYANIPSMGVHRSLSLDACTLAQAAAEQSGCIDRFGYLVPPPQHSSATLSSPTSSCSGSSPGKGTQKSPTLVTSPFSSLSKKKSSRANVSTISGGGGSAPLRQKSKVRASLSLFTRKSSTPTMLSTPEVNEKGKGDGLYVEMNSSQRLQVLRASESSTTVTTTTSGSSLSLGSQENHYMVMDLRKERPSSGAGGRSARSSTSHQSSSLRSSVLNSSDSSLSSSSETSLDNALTSPILSPGGNRSVPTSPIPLQGPNAGKVAAKHARTRSEPLRIFIQPQPTEFVTVEQPSASPIVENTYMNLRSSQLCCEETVNYAKIILVNRPTNNEKGTLTHQRSLSVTPGGGTMSVMAPRCSDNTEYAEINHMATAAAHQLALYRLDQANAAKENSVSVS